MIKQLPSVLPVFIPAAFSLFSGSLSVPSRQGHICILIWPGEAAGATCEEEEAELGTCTLVSPHLPKGCLVPYKPFKPF